MNMPGYCELAFCTCGGKHNSGRGPAVGQRIRAAMNESGIALHATDLCSICGSKSASQGGVLGRVCVPHLACAPESPSPGSRPTWLRCGLPARR